MAYMIATVVVEKPLGPLIDPSQHIDHVISLIRSALSRLPLFQSASGLFIVRYVTLRYSFVKIQLEIDFTSLKQGLASRRPEVVP